MNKVFLWSVNMNPVITLATSKGGAGKSTLARSLGGHWFNVGMKLAIIDADPQGSIINKHDPQGLMGTVTVIADPEETVFNTIESLQEEYSPIIVDTGGFRNRTTIRALVKSDIALIPLKPSADDVSSAIETYNLIQEINQTPERKSNPIKYRMVLTMTQQGTVISKHVRQELVDMGYLLLRSELNLRVSYPEAALKGLPPNLVEPESPAARDISSIVSEINSIL